MLCFLSLLDNVGLRWFVHNVVWSGSIINRLCPVTLEGNILVLASNRSCNSLILHGKGYGVWGGVWGASSGEFHLIQLSRRITVTPLGHTMVHTDQTLTPWKSLLSVMNPPMRIIKSFNTPALIRANWQCMKWIKRMTFWLGRIDSSKVLYSSGALPYKY